MSLDQVEAAIAIGIKRAHRRYESMTSWWLSHGPEYFLTTYISNAVHERTKRSVYLEISPKKVAKFDFDYTVGKSTDSIRPDISVWSAKDDSIDACIEVKRAWSLDQITKDVERLRDLLRSDRCNTGYIVAYSEDSNNIQTYKKRHLVWAEKTRGLLVTSYTKQQKDLGCWAFCILKFVPESR